MAKVLGIGGIFFKSKDPEKLCAWYEEWLSFSIDKSTASASFRFDRMPRSSFTVWSPFQSNTTYFAPSDKGYMINLIVDDLDEALEQVARGGAEIIGEIEAYDNGRFGWFIDPDGNKVELWALEKKKG